MLPADIDGAAPQAGSAAAHSRSAAILTSPGRRSRPPAGG
jgi:hypothetical protein